LIEYTGQGGLLEYLISQDYLIFDTEYFFLGSPTENAKKQFTVSRENITLSTNAKAWGSSEEFVGEKGRDGMV
jgi:hypothetical protein